MCSAASWLLISLNIHALPNANAQELEVWTRSAADWHEDVSFLPFCARKSLRSLKLEVRGLYLDLHSVQNHIYIWCIHGISGRGVTKYTVTHGVSIRLWPTLSTHVAAAHTTLDVVPHTYIITSTGKYLPMRINILLLVLVSIYRCEWLF